MLDRKLTIEEQQELLSSLFGFSVENINDENAPPHYVIYDSEGDEFHGYSRNDAFDLSTLRGIIAYATQQSAQSGFENFQYKMRQLLGIQ